MPSQLEADKLVSRIRELVYKHGGNADILANVREAYAFWEACPGDNMAYIMMLDAVIAAERKSLS